MLPHRKEFREKVLQHDRWEAVHRRHDRSNTRNDNMADAKGFSTYDDFLAAVDTFKDGFGVVDGEDVQKQELAAFFSHVAHETSC